MAAEAADPERATWQRKNANPEKDNVVIAEGHQAYAEPSKANVRTASPSLALRSPLLSSAEATLGQSVRCSPVISLVAENFCQDTEVVLQTFNSSSVVEILQVHNHA